MHGKNRGNFQPEERERFPEEKPPSNLQQPNPFLAYNHSTANSSYIDNSRHAMSMMSTYNMIPAMNPQWGVNPMYGMSMTPTNMPGNSSSTAPMATGMDMTQAPFAYMANNHMYGMMGIGNYSQFGTENTSPIKEVVELTKSVLFPPNPNGPPPTTREKPPGCKTVFVGGLPENATEDILKEVFERCGEILTIRMSKKNFCHIRFSNKTSVEQALQFSGYRIKIENKDEAAFTGKLHVDYAQARDDQHEYECEQRALQREARHKKQTEEDSRPPSPLTVHFSENEATVLMEKLRAEDTFAAALHVLTSWVERGECNKRNAGTFYSMVQSVNSQVQRLLNEKGKFEDELNKAEMTLKQKVQDILLLFTKIIKLFIALSMQKVWDQFSKPQRKNMDLWKKQTEEIKHAHVVEVLNDRIEDDMDFSEDESDENIKKKNLDTTELKKFDDEVNKLREEAAALRHQLEIAENEAAAMQSEMAQEIAILRREIKKLKEPLDKESKIPKRSSEEAQLKDLHSFKKRTVSETENPDTRNNLVSISSSSTFNEREGRLITLISIFLNVHSFGANIDYICSYLHQIDSTIELRDVENLMKQFPLLFREDYTGIGASLGKKWTYLGFEA